MLNLEQVKLLETKVAKIVDYLDRLTKENAALHQQKTELQGKLVSCQKRVDELELLVMDFKEDQGQIEEGILSALDRLSQFEKAIDKSLKDKRPVKDTTAKKSLLIKATEDATVAEAPVTPEADSAQAEEAADAADSADEAAQDGQTCFEIQEPSTEALPKDVIAAIMAGGDVADPLEGAAVETAPAENRELDIF